MSVQTGRRLVFGVVPEKPIIGAPEGKQRIKLRNKSYAKLFVKTGDGMRQFVLEDLGDKWRCGFEQGRNIIKLHTL